MASRVGALFVALGLDDAQYRAGMSGAVGTAKKSTALIQTNFSTLNFRTFLYGMAGIYAVKAAIEGIMTPAINFESQMAKVSTVLDKAAMTMMPAFTEQLKTMAKDTGQSTEALSSGLYDILGSVIAPTEAMGLLGIANKSAIAGMTDTATTTSALVTIIKSYGMETSKAADISDVLFATVLRGRLTFEELASGIGVVAATAAQAGLRFEEVSAMISVMTRAGLSADMSMISLANMLNTFISPSTQSAKAAEEMGFALNTATLRSIGLAGVLKILSKATQEQVGAIFPNIRGLRGFMAALADTKGFAEDLEIALHSQGMTMEAFAKQYNTTREVLKRFGQVLLVDIVMPFTTALLPAITNATASIRTWMEANKDLIKINLTHWAIGTKNAIEELIKFIMDWYKPALVAMTLLFGASMIEKMMGFGTTIKNLTVLVGTFTKALFGMQALAVLPTGLLGLGILAIGGAVYLGVQGIRDHLEKIDQMKFSGVKVMEDAIGVIGGDPVAKNIKALEDTFTNLAKQGKPFGEGWKSFLDVMKGKNLIELYGAELKTLAQIAYGAYYKKGVPQGPLPAKDMFDTWTDEQYKEGEKLMKFYAERGMRWYKASQDRLDAQAKLEQDAADETIKITRDTEMEKLSITYTNMNLQLAQLDKEEQYYLADLEAKYSATVNYENLRLAATQYYANQRKLIELQAAQEIADNTEQEWKTFKSHFSSILARMVNEGEFSAKAIAQAFADAFRRIAIERAAAFTVGKVFDFVKMLPVIGGALTWLATLGTGGMVYKPSLALVGESGPERVLNPAETRRYNSTNSDDHSNVNIHIHADSDTLRSLNPYKFAEMYKEAKRSQLLTG